VFISKNTSQKVRIVKYFLCFVFKQEELQIRGKTPEWIFRATVKTRCFINSR